MKKVLLSVVALVLIAGASFAQEQGQIRLTAGLALGSKAAIDDDGDEKLGAGINIGGEYFFTDAISAAPSYTYFFKSTVGEDPNEFSYRISSLNLDGRYYFLTEGVQVYGMAGLAFLSLQAESTTDFFGTPITVEVDDNETGLNIGGGVVLPLGESVGLNGQIKYQTPGDGQLVLNAGVVFSLN